MNLSTVIGVKETSQIKHSITNSLTIARNFKIDQVGIMEAYQEYDNSLLPAIDQWQSLHLLIKSESFPQINEDK